MTDPNDSAGVSLHSQGDTEFALRRAILLYEGAGQVYASLHDVSDRGHIRPGCALEHSAIAAFVDAMAEQRRYTGFLATHLLYAEPGLIVWWWTSKRRRVWFQCNNDAAPDQTADNTGAALLGNRSGDTPHPALVFAVKGGQWFVRALDQLHRPQPTDPLWLAPYFNVNARGEICTGNVRLPERCDSAMTAKFEDAFFRSRFTHPNAARITTHPKGSYALWSELLDGQHNEFPRIHLFPAKQTLDQWVKSLLKGST